MKRTAFFALTLFLAISGVIALTLWLLSREGVTRPFPLTNAEFQEEVPGFSWAIGLHQDNLAKEFAIGDTLTLWLVVEYDTARFRIEPDSLKDSDAQPFEVRSFRQEEKKIERGLVRVFFEMVFQCVTCAPGKTHTLEGLALRYHAVGAPTDVRELAFNLKVTETFLFNTDTFSLYPPDFETFPPRLPHARVMLGFGVGMAVAGAFMVARFFPRRRRVTKESAPASGQELFTAKIALLRACAGEHEESRRELLHQFYGACAEFAMQEFHYDVMDPRDNMNLLPREFLALLAHVKRAYGRSSISEDTVREAFQLCDTFLTSLVSREVC